MNTHHANLIWSDSLETASLPEAYIKPGLDIDHIVVERFTIDDARELTRLSEQKPFVSNQRIFIIVTNDIAIEAQNALLKLFEEPRSHVVFYLILKQAAFLLPTLRSRLSEETKNRDKVEDVYSTFDAFLAATYAERISDIAEKTKNKDSIWIEEILRGYESYTVNASSKKKELLESVLFVRTYSGSKGASLKMLLEELALTLPVK